MLRRFTKRCTHLDQINESVTPAADFILSKPSGTSAPARSTFSASSCCCACGGRSRVPTRASRPAEKAAKTKMPKTGMASRLAIREIALLTPEASPEWLPETEFIAVVVRGAMTRDMPRPITTTAGKKVVQYEPPVPGTANSMKPAAATVGPITSGSFAP